MNVKHIMTWPVFSIGPDATVLQAVQMMLRHKISGLPAGDYTVEAVHLKAGNKSEKVKVGADEKKAQDFTFEAKAAQ